MFSFAAINDTESKDHWEPSAPTKEAQEFHLSQLYHEGLLKLECKEYVKAQELLECILKDPIIANTEVESSTSDGHLRQLRFLALKNLASVFLEQGPTHHENALSCYLQAIEIDGKDSVVWNHLGTLSYSMGLMSISRWAFEQGLQCSPNNWSCMEKLLEVLIAIGDEVACLSITELILRRWPSHSRALHVKRVIEETDSIPFAPKGIDKLEAKHVRLKFQGKRKACRESHEDEAASKKFKESIELKLPEASWVALTDALLRILRPSSEISNISGHIPITLQLPSSSENVVKDSEKNPPFTPDTSKECSIRETSGVKEKDAVSSEEHTQERRSTRLERLRSQKPEKDEIDLDNNRDPAKRILQYLETFILSKQETSDLLSTSILCTHQANLISEHMDVAGFVREVSRNYGAYHLAHLLLEHASSKVLTSQNVFVKLLELEKLTRHWGRERKPECSLFLAELYIELGYSASEFPDQCVPVSEASYQLCKILEIFALNFPSDANKLSWKDCGSVPKIFQVGQEMVLDDPVFSNKRLFWIRYFWVSGRLSILEGDKGKALKEFCNALSLLEKDNMDGSSCAVRLPHCKSTKELNIDKVLHQMNILKIDFLLKETVPEMMKKESYTECIELLVPLLFLTKDVMPGPAATTKDDETTSVELSVLDVLIDACSKTKPMDIEVYLNCHRRKLQILMILSSMDMSLASCRHMYQESGSDISSYGSSREMSTSYWSCMVAEEVKAISQCVSQVRSFMDQSGNSNGLNIPRASVADIQSLLLAVMLTIARNILSRNSSEPLDAVQTEEKQRCCFIDAAIAFCKIQHLDYTVPTKTQVELIAGVHDLLAEYGLCCAGANSEAEEGTYLRFAIKHLLALDMKFKSNANSSFGEMPPSDLTSENESRSKMLDVDIDRNEQAVSTFKKEDGSEPNTKRQSSTPVLEAGNTAQGSNVYRKLEKVNQDSSQHPECENEPEEEKEELELLIDNALDQCFYCLYGLNLRGDSAYEDDLALHKNTRRGDYQTKEQCADVFQYLLPYAKASSRTGLVKLRRVLRAIRKHFTQPSDDILAVNVIDKFLDDHNLCEDHLLNEAGSVGFLETMTKLIFAGHGNIKQYKASLCQSSEPYMDVYQNLYYFLAQSEETSATDKWTGFVLTKEGEEFIRHNANLVKYDLLYNPLRFESWEKLANIYDEEVDLLLNDGSKHINVTGWRKNAALPQRVETSRRRSRRCLLMSLALAKTPDQQCEIHELLALVYYDTLQNVVPFFDQRSIVPSKDAAWVSFCENSLEHFKKAFQHRQDWSHAFYMGKLCEKLGYSYEMSLSYYDKAIALNPLAVDPVYRMHASRLKLLNTCGKNNLKALKILAAYCFDESTKSTALTIISTMAPEASRLVEEVEDGHLKVNSAIESEGSIQMEGVWHMLYNDSLSALESCVEGDLKHFHKARYMLAQGLYKRGGSSDLQKAKDELSFCFKSSRSSFTINMWEIDGMVKKGRRKTPGLAGNKKSLEVNLPESSRKFITCIRKYLLFYLQLLEETGDISTLERAYISLKSDKRFSLCIEDLVPVAIGRYIKTLISSMGQRGSPGCSSRIHTNNQLEKLFFLFIEQGNLWPEICNLPEIRSLETSESTLYRFLHQYIVSLELNNKSEMLETINERIRKRFKNPKVSNSHSAKVGKHASTAWCRSLVIALASITSDTVPKDTPGLEQTYHILESRRILCVDVQSKDFWSSSFEDSAQLQSLETKWGPALSKIRNVTTVRKVSEEYFETANSLLRSCYNFYKETSCVTLPSGVSLYLVPPQSVAEGQFHQGMDGTETIEVSLPRKLLLWAYTLLHGHCASIACVVKYMEENAKPKTKRGATSILVTPTTAGNSRDVSIHGESGEQDGVSKAVHVASSGLLSGTDSTRASMTPKGSSVESQKGMLLAPQVQHCNNSAEEKKSAGLEDDDHPHA